MHSNIQDLLVGVYPTAIQRVDGLKPHMVL